MRHPTISPVLDKLRLHTRVHACNPEFDTVVLENIYTEEKVEFSNASLLIDHLQLLDKLGVVKKGV